MEVGEGVQVSRKRQPLLLASSLQPVRVFPRMLSLALFFDLADLLAQPAGDSIFQF
jgi:hypothetical protein